jgi:hypothetical protein
MALSDECQLGYLMTKVGKICGFVRDICGTFAARDKDALFPLWIIYIGRGTVNALQPICSVVCNVVSMRAGVGRLCVSS